MSTAIYGGIINTIVSVTTLIEIVGILLILGGAVGAFYTLQTRQNMKIKTLEDKVFDLQGELSEEREKRIQLSEVIAEIKTDLKHILSAINELKQRPGC